MGAISPASGFFSQWQTQSLLTTGSKCNPAFLSLPTIKGLQVLSIGAIEQQNYTFIPNPLFGGAQDPIVGLAYCSVTVTYTHPGWNDSINVMTYLPSEKKWNGRFQANGGAGYITGGEELAQFTMIPGLAHGSVVSTTDGGHRVTGAEANSYSSSWALSSPGNVNWPLLVDFAHLALHDMATIGKVLTKSYYGSPPKYSYFFGASTGGRQGHMLAQRYPKDFDGIIALFPAMNWARFLFANIYPTFIMDSKKRIGSSPGLDYVILTPIRSLALLSTADVTEAAWNGPRSASGEFQWYGFGIDANISQRGMGAATTECDADGNCRSVPFPISDVWARFWVVKDPDFDMKTISHEKWDEIFHASVSEYESVIGTSDPDLSAFRKAGGKMINWHGISDQLILVNGSVDYYEQVLKRDPKVQDFYRLFLAPGASHCFDCGVTPPVTDLIKVIMGRVENGTAPDTLRALGPNRYGTELERNICMYPRVQHYVGGDFTKPEAFICV